MFAAANITWDPFQKWREVDSSRRAGLTMDETAARMAPGFIVIIFLVCEKDTSKLPGGLLSALHGSSRPPVPVASTPPPRAMREGGMGGEAR